MTPREIPHEDPVERVLREIEKLAAGQQRIRDDFAEFRTELEGRLTRIEGVIAHRVQVEDEWFQRTWPGHLREHETLGVKVATLEAVHHRAQGAAWAGRALAALVALASAFVGWSARGQPADKPTVNSTRVGP